MEKGACLVMVFVCFNIGRVLTIWIITDHNSSFGSHFQLCQVEYGGIDISILEQTSYVFPVSVFLHGVVSESMIWFPFGWKKPKQHKTQKKIHLRSAHNALQLFIQYVEQI